MNSKTLILLAGTLVSGCVTNDSGRYKDNADLERPPAMAIDKQTTEGQNTSETTVTQRRHGKGLGSDIYRLDESSLVLIIKRPFEEAWLLVHRAIQSNDLKVTDQDRSKGIYYVLYNGGGLLSSAISIFEDEARRSIYVLKVEGEGEETQVTVSLANKDEQANRNNAKDSETNEDRSSNLFDLLYDSLHDDVKED